MIGLPMLLYLASVGERTHSVTVACSFYLMGVAPSDGYPVFNSGGSSLPIAMECSRNQLDNPILHDVFGPEHHCYYSHRWTASHIPQTHVNSARRLVLARIHINRRHCRRICRTVFYIFLALPYPLRAQQPVGTIVVASSVASSGTY